MERSGRNGPARRCSRHQPMGRSRSTSAEPARIPLSGCSCLWVWLCACGPGFHLADRDLERVRTESEHAAEPLEGRERSRCVVAHAVEAVREREVRRRALPALPPEAGGFERGAKRLRCEVEEVLARLVVIPKAAEESRL